MIRLMTCFFVCLAACVQGDIYEIMHLNELHAYLEPEMLVIWDIDNTLLEPIQEIGSNQWFENRIDEYISYGYDKDKALETALSEWTAIQSITKVKVCEPGTQDIIHKLHSQGFKMMGLTSRGLRLCTRTIEQLDSVGIDLSINAPTKEEIHFMNTRGVLLRDGIFFMAGTHKGRGLFTLLDKIGYKPKSVMFINDKETHLAQIEETCKEKGVPFVGLRYGYTDEKVKNFRKQIAEVQFYFFGHIMSDEAAERYLHEHEKLMGAY